MTCGDMPASSMRLTGTPCMAPWRPSWPRRRREAVGGDACGFGLCGAQACVDSRQGLNRRETQGSIDPGFSTVPANMYACHVHALSIGWNQESLRHDQHAFLDSKFNLSFRSHGSAVLARSQYLLHVPHLTRKPYSAPAVNISQDTHTILVGPLEPVLLVAPWLIRGSCAKSVMSMARCVFR